VSIISELKSERTNLANQLKHADAALSVLGSLCGGKFYTETEANFVSRRCT